MKIAITTSGNDLNSPLDARFGRAARFLLYDMEANSFTLVDNAQNLNAAQGAGIQAATTVVRAGAEALITGNCGPKAFLVLKEAGVKVYNTRSATVKEALDQFSAGLLAEAEAANVEGHWS